MVRRCPWMRIPEPVWRRSVSRCVSRAESSWRSLRSTTRRCWCCTRSPRHWPRGTRSCSNRLDGHRDPPGRGRGNQETVVGTGRLLPGDRAARRRHRHGRIRGGGRGLHQRRPGVHLGAAGDRRRTRDADFLDALVPKVDAITTGDPAREGHPSAAISETEATRVHSAIQAAGKSGAKLLTGGDRDGAVITPAVVAASTHRRRCPATSCSDPPSPISAPDIAARSPSPTTANTAWAPGFSPATWPARCAPCARSTPATSTSTGPRCGGPI